MKIAPPNPLKYMADPDLELLAFAAEHRFILAEHARALLGRRPFGALQALERAGLLGRDRSLGVHGCYFVTRAGMRTLDLPYGARKLSYDAFHHDVGMAWLWLAAQRGSFGPLSEIVSERAMRSHDKRAGPADALLRVRLGGGGRHYPDLLLKTPQNKRIAVELELTSKPPRRRETILMAYAADARIDAVVYLVQNRAAGRAIQESARRVGISDLVHVQLVRGLPAPASTARATSRAHVRGENDAVR